MNGLFSAKLNECVEVNGVSFKRITEADKDFMSGVMYELQYNCCNLNFQYLISCNGEHDTNYVYRMVDNTMCIFAYHPNAHKYKMEMVFAPLPTDDNKIDYKKVLSEVKQILTDVNGEIKRQVGHAIPFEVATEFRGNVESLKVMKTFDEFIYDVKYLAELKGGKLATVRRDYNKFERSYPNVVFEQYTLKYMKDCQRLRKLWEAEYESRTDGSSVRNLSFDYFIKNILNTETTHAYILRDGDKVIAYNGIVKLYDGVCVSAIRTCDNSYKNCASYILIRSMQELNKLGYEYMNDGYTSDYKKEHLSAFKSRFINNDDYSNGFPMYTCSL